MLPQADISQNTFRVSLTSRFLDTFGVPPWTSEQCFGDTCPLPSQGVSLKSPLNVLGIRVQVVLLLARRTYLSNVQRGGNGHGLSQESARFAAVRDNKLR